MKLNADIIFENLAEEMNVSRFGKNIGDLILSRPVFLSESMKLQKNSCMLCQASSLTRVEPKPDCLVICYGNELPEKWKKQNSSVFFIQEDIDILVLFNTLQHIFDKYDEWDQTLSEMENTIESLAHAVQATKLLLGNPIDIVNEEMVKVVRGTSLKVPAEILNEPDTEPVPISYTFLEPHKDVISSIIRKKKPFSLHDNFGEHYCINIFVEQKRVGVVALNGIRNPITPSARRLFQYFVEKISRIVAKDPGEGRLAVITFRDIVKYHLKMLDLTAVQICQLNDWELNSKRLSDYNAFAVITTSVRADKVYYSLSYLCNIIESIFPMSCAFEEDPQRLIAVVPLASSAEYQQCLLSGLGRLAKDLQLVAGISDPFFHLKELPIYTAHAKAACEIGLLEGSKSSILFFEEIKLEYMLLNAKGHLSLSELIPEGLGEILESRGHVDGIDYWHTLKVLLDNEMNIAAASRELYLHRSSLLKRIDKIKSLIPLEDSRDRLHIRMCMQLYELLHG